MIYRFSCQALECGGDQHFLVEAKDEKEAREKFDRGEHEFECDETEITHLGKPEVSIAGPETQMPSKIQCPHCHTKSYFGKPSICEDCGEEL